MSLKDASINTAITDDRHIGDTDAREPADHQPEPTIYGRRIGAIGCSGAAGLRANGVVVGESRTASIDTCTPRAPAGINRLWPSVDVTYGWE
ncbi:MAG: hypothetical protein ACRDQZ_08505 [Mycobacteriales bacterium]